MFYSCLLINVGNNPDRPRPGRRWLSNRYHVHQRLCMAFPPAKKKADDPQFLKPFNPDDFTKPVDGAAQVHVERKENAGFLFRVDPLPGNGVIVLVQSAVKPDWDYAFNNAGHLLAAKPEVKEFEPSFSNGDLLRFRLTANPTRKIDTKTGPDGKKNNGQRVPVPEEQLNEWLARKGGENGFQVEQSDFVTGYVYVRKRPDEQGQRLFAVTYNGRLPVTHAGCFHQALAAGIGPAKAFGFGLLSAARAAG